jgi:hypothetical protein
MHVEVFGSGYAARAPGPARPSLWRRMVERARMIGTTYEVDEHLANDIGAETYTVPLFPSTDQGGWK